MNSILIYTDHNRISEFRKDVSDTADRSNELIDLFENLQTWKKIQSVDDFIELAVDPKTTFDDVIIANVQITAGSKKVNPEVAASLFDIPRSEFMNLVAGIPIIDDTCIPCQKLKIRKGQRSIHINEFNRFSRFLNFDGRFSVNPTAVDEHIKTFSIYASTDQEIALYNHWMKLVTVLNEHVTKYPVNSSEMENIKRSLRLHLSKGDSGEFMTNPEILKNEIMLLKYRNNENTEHH